MNNDIANTPVKQFESLRNLSSGYGKENHFVQLDKMVEISLGASKKVTYYQISRQEVEAHD